MTLQDWTILLGLLSTFITVVVVPSVILIINAVNKNTTAVTTGNAEAAVADAKKITLAEVVAKPFAPVAADPLEARLKRIEEQLAHPQ